VKHPDRGPTVSLERVLDGKVALVTGSEMGVDGGYTAQ
jgi:hypothetical protein